MTTYTDTQLLSGEVRRRTDQFRLDLLDLTGAVIGTLPYDVERAPTVSWEATGRLQRTLSGLVLPAGTYGDLDVVSMQVRPVMTLQNGSEYLLGVFRWSDDQELQRSWGTDRATSMVDRSTILDQQLTRAVALPVGWNPVTMAINLAQEVLPPEQIEWTGTAFVVSAPMSWPIGASRLQVMSELLAQAGYLPPYFDRRGVCQLRPAPDPFTVTDPVQWPLGYPVVAGSRTRTNTLLDTPNVWVVHDSSGQGGGIVGRYQVPDAAEHSIARRGYPVPEVVSVSGLASQAAADAQAYARAVADGRAFAFQQFTSPADPRHDAWTVVEFRGVRWLETAWKLLLRNGGLMPHTLRRVYGLLGNFG